jgi:predicted RNA-binding Zn-ribbon protein involved in translation (DUF1610 family)
MSPFGPYLDFADCVSKNKDKKTPEAYCAFVHHKITGKWPSEKNVTSVLPKKLTCPVCSNPVSVNRANIRLKCPNCGTSLVSVKIRRIRR